MRFDSLHRCRLFKPGLADTAVARTTSSKRLRAFASAKKFVKISRPLSGRVEHHISEIQPEFRFQRPLLSNLAAMGRIALEFSVKSVAKHDFDRRSIGPLLSSCGNRKGGDHVWEYWNRARTLSVYATAKKKTFATSETAVDAITIRSQVFAFAVFKSLSEGSPIPRI